MKARSTPLRKVLASPWLFIEYFQYAKDAISNRHWLTEAIEHKDEVISFLRGQKRKEALRVFRHEFDQFVGMAGSIPRLSVDLADINPQLLDRANFTPFDRHYTYHPAWAARVLAKTRPNRHVDISSIVNFCAVVSAFIPVEFYDFRPAPITLDGLYTGAADLTKLHFPSDSVASLSCMHVIEHIGLGRYGDPLDPDGDLKAIGELVRVLTPGGDLLVATPVGRPRVAFNAHRVYDHEVFARYFAPLELVEFALVEEHGEGGLIVAPPPERVQAESYGCGCFWFRKPKIEEQVES
jgi:SAM-dependent methyltransferase